MRYVITYGQSVCDGELSLLVPLFLAYFVAVGIFGRTCMEGVGGGGDLEEWCDRHWATMREGDSGFVNGRLFSLSLTREYCYESTRQSGMGWNGIKGGTMKADV